MLCTFIQVMLRAASVRGATGTLALEDAADPAAEPAGDLEAKLQDAAGACGVSADRAADLTGSRKRGGRFASGILEALAANFPRRMTRVLCAGPHFEVFD